MTDFRALCAELLQELEHASDWDYQQALKDQARAALAQPEPVAPTDKELHQLWQELYSFHDGPTSGEVVEIARAVLERWGTH